MRVCVRGYASLYVVCARACLRMRACVGCALVFALVLLWREKRGTLEREGRRRGSQRARQERLKREKERQRKVGGVGKGRMERCRARRMGIAGRRERGREKGRQGGGEGE